MQFTIKQDVPGRLRIRVGAWVISAEEARGVEEVLEAVPGVEAAMVHPANGSVLVEYSGQGVREEVLACLRSLRPMSLPQPSGTECALAESRALDNEFQLNLMRTLGAYGFKRLFLPPPLRAAITLFDGVRFIREGVRELAHGHVNVSVLDATAIATSLMRGKHSTAGSVMLMLNISDILAGYAQKRARFALRQNLALFAEKVWLVDPATGTEVEVEATQVREGDILSVRMGTLVPVDGIVVEGQAALNESAMTGEAALVQKEPGSTVFAATVVEEGNLRIRATQDAGASRIDSIVELVENSEDLKAVAQSRAEQLADSMVPFSLGLFAATLALTRNVEKAMSVLMVDYSCAIKLATPIAVMSAMREATRLGVVVKGGKYLEALAAADTIVFDKTGTLTTSEPALVDILRFDSRTKEEVLALAACLEEHFPHSMARAIVAAAEERGLRHMDEQHAEVEYIVAHGIVSAVDGMRVAIGSAHFIFEDEGVERPADLTARIENEVPATSTIFLAIDGRLSAVLCIADQLRPEAAAVVAGLHEVGFTRVVMLTGDSQNYAAAVAAQLGIDEFEAQMLPEQKAGYIERLKAEGACVCMVGDGINDSPALAAANVSVAMADASDIARAVADVSVMDASLEALIPMRQLACGLTRRIDSSYNFIVAFNSALIAGGIAGWLPSATSALLHNASTLALAAKNTTPLLEGTA